MSSISGVMSTAAAGLMAASARLDRTAKTVAGPNGLDSLPDSLVQSKIDQLDFKANAVVLKTADKMLGTLLDLLDTDATRR